MNVIVFNKMEHDVTQKPVPSLWHHALGFQCARFRFPKADVVRLLRGNDEVFTDPSASETVGRRALTHLTGNALALAAKKQRCFGWS